MPEILTASWVVPGDGPPVRDGCVGLEAGRIGWLRGPEARASAVTVRDLGPGVLLPGLVNAHTHLELGPLAGRLPLGAFIPWVRALVEGRDACGPEETSRSVADQIAALVACGTAAIGDVSNGLAHLDALAASPLAAVVFFEQIGWDPVQATRAAGRVETRMRSLPPGLGEGDVAVRLAAHAPHSVSAALFRELARLGGVAALHLAESPAETRFLAHGDGEWAAFLADRGVADPAFAPPGVSPVRYVDGLGVLRPGLVAAHCVHASERDLDRLAATGTSVVVCPRSNAALGVGRAPVPAMLRAGVRLALGTDSLASAPDLDVSREMVALRREHPELSAAAIVRMATAGGADALGLADFGRLGAGARAALAFAPAPSVPADPLEFLVSGEARIRSVEAA